MNGDCCYCSSSRSSSSRKSGRACEYLTGSRRRPSTRPITTSSGTSRRMKWLQFTPNDESISACLRVLGKPSRMTPWLFASNCSNRSFTTEHINCTKGEKDRSKRKREKKRERERERERRERERERELDWIEEETKKERKDGRENARKQVQ